ncbi:phage major tail protein, TP901-1 family [Ornithinibacillus bavariensis]|uniref:Phage major tail protein, TP901-1 family n=1 Tax=Ornithinibacillus bavariensis TaxID=545502 RepID=A0A919X8X8_9BACI|nr:phage major tail protein, TP901-1 family [Ornithinibacillus bavariensis]GIO27736.1 phage major tail protein, TP901-1 family [Ornithinibacillus bavariensis]
MAVEFRGEEFLYLVEVPSDTEGETTRTYRLFNQTSGSTTSEADAIDLSTKDKSGSDYGNVTQSISVEGVLTEGDTAIAYVKTAQRQRKFVKIIEVNTRTMTTEAGNYMISSFERSFSNGEHATYTLEGSLNGSIQEGTLAELPEGASDNN